MEGSIPCSMWHQRLSGDINSAGLCQCGVSASAVELVCTEVAIGAFTTAQLAGIWSWVIPAARATRTYISFLSCGQAPCWYRMVSLLRGNPSAHCFRPSKTDTSSSLLRSRREEKAAAVELASRSLPKLPNKLHRVAKVRWTQYVIN